MSVRLGWNGSKSENLINSKNNKTKNNTRMWLKWKKERREFSPKQQQQQEKENLKILLYKRGHGQTGKTVKGMF